MLVHPTTLRPLHTTAAYALQLIPSDIKFDANATPPQFTDNGDQVIEAGTHIRMKLIGTRSDVGSMFAIGSIKEARVPTPDLIE
jgi:hypothetical protein